MCLWVWQTLHLARASLAKLIIVSNWSLNSARCVMRLEWERDGEKGLGVYYCSMVQSHKKKEKEKKEDRQKQEHLKDKRRRKRTDNRSTSWQVFHLLRKTDLYGGLWGQPDDEAALRISVKKTKQKTKRSVDVWIDTAQEMFTRNCRTQRKSRVRNYRVNKVNYIQSTISRNCTHCVLIFRELYSCES